jgi:hypothetical protein
MVDDADKVINSKPIDKVCIKIEQLWNEDCDGDFNIPNIKSLSIGVLTNAIEKLKKLKASLT